MKFSLPRLHPPKHFLIKAAYITFFLAIIAIVSQIRVIGLDNTIENLNEKVAALNHQISNLTKEIKQIKSEDARKILEQYNNVVGKYETIKEKTANYKNQGVNVSTVESQLPKAIDLILGKKYQEAEGLLSSLDAELEKLLKDKQAADSAAKSQTSTTKTTGCGVPSSGYCYLLLKTSAGSFYTHILATTLSGISTDTANSSNCTDNCPTKTLATYVSENGGANGIHGTYFCPPDYASCAGKVNSFDFPVYNTRLGRWINEDKLAWSNRAMMAFTSGGAVFYPQASSYSGLGGLRAAIVNYPGLVYNGQNIVGNYSLTSAQYTKGTRGGIGVKGGTVYFVISSSASVPDFAAVMMTIGVTHALNLDGGGSAALIYQGRYKVGPGRALPNAIVAK